MRDDTFAAAIERAMLLVHEDNWGDTVFHKMAHSLGGACDTFFVGSPELRDIVEKARTIGRNRSVDTVMILGETGTGKEFLARLLHRERIGALHSEDPNEEYPFVKAACNQRDGNLFYSEIFGHSKGAFTGAVDRVGKASLAARGTLFLDEIGELSQESQSKLLEFLQSWKIEPQGGTGSRFEGILVVAATRKPIWAHLGDKEGEFRPDLYYRLAQRLSIPPLKDRKGDIIPIALTTLQGLAEDAGERVQTLTEEVRDWLQSYEWTAGNARQLANLVKQAAVNARGREVSLDHLREAWNDDLANSAFPECRIAGTHSFDTRSGSGSVSICEISPEDIADGRVPYQELSDRCRGDRERIVALLVAARALFPGTQADFARLMETPRANLYSRFSAARKALAKGSLQTDEIKRAVDPRHHKAIDDFVRRSRQTGRG